MTLKNVPVLILSVLFALHANATTYTAINSGKFSDNATWQGGNIPPATLSGSDSIQIDSGVAVELDVDLHLTNTTTLIVGKNASLFTNGNESLTLESKTQIIGDGNALVKLNMVYFKERGGNVSNFRGRIEADSIYLATWIFNDDSLTVKVNDVLKLLDDTSILMKGHFVFDTTAGNKITVFLSGGYIYKFPTGVIDTNKAYDAYYDTAKTTTWSNYGLFGMFINGSGLENVTIDVDSSKSMRLYQNLVMKGLLTLLSGELDFYGYGLTFDTTGSFSDIGNGELKFTKWGHSQNDISIRSTNTGWTLRMKDNTSLRDFIIDIPEGEYIKLNADIEITGNLNFRSGVLDVGHNSVTINSTGKTYGGSEKSFMVCDTGGRLVQGAKWRELVTYPIGVKYTGGTYPEFFYAPVHFIARKTHIPALDVTVRSQALSYGDKGYNIADKQPVVNATWLIGRNVYWEVSADIELGWIAPGMERNGFNWSNARMLRYNTNNGWGLVANSGSGKKVSSAAYSIGTDSTSVLGAFTIIDYNAQLSVNDLPETEQILAYPNPVKDILRLNYKGRVSIYNMQGQMVVNEQIEHLINVSALPAGVYQLQTEDGQSSRFTKQ